MKPIGEGPEDTDNECRDDNDGSNDPNASWDAFGRFGVVVVLVLLGHCVSAPLSVRSIFKDHYSLESVLPKVSTLNAPSRAEEMRIFGLTGGIIKV